MKNLVRKTLAASALLSLTITGLSATATSAIAATTNDSGGTLLAGFADSKTKKKIAQSGLFSGHNQGYQKELIQSIQYQKAPVKLEITVNSPSLKNKHFYRGGGKPERYDMTQFLTGKYKISVPVELEPVYDKKYYDDFSKHVYDKAAANSALNGVKTVSNLAGKCENGGDKLYAGWALKISKNFSPKPGDLDIETNYFGTGGRERFEGGEFFSNKILEIPPQSLEEFTNGPRFGSPIMDFIKKDVASKHFPGKYIAHREIIRKNGAVGDVSGVKTGPGFVHIDSDSADSEIKEYRVSAEPRSLGQCESLAYKENSLKLTNCISKVDIEVFSTDNGKPVSVGKQSIDMKAYAKSKDSKVDYNDGKWTGQWCERAENEYYRGVYSEEPLSKIFKGITKLPNNYKITFTTHRDSVTFSKGADVKISGNHGSKGFRYDATSSVNGSFTSVKDYSCGSKDSHSSKTGSICSGSVKMPGQGEKKDKIGNTFKDILNRGNNEKGSTGTKTPTPATAPLPLPGSAEGNGQQLPTADPYNSKKLDKAQPNYDKTISSSKKKEEELTQNQKEKNNKIIEDLDKKDSTPKSEKENPDASDKESGKSTNNNNNNSNDEKKVDENHKVTDKNSTKENNTTTNGSNKDTNVTPKPANSGSTPVNSRNDGAPFTNTSKPYVNIVPTNIIINEVGEETPEFAPYYVCEYNSLPKVDGVETAVGQVSKGRKHSISYTPPVIKEIPSEGAKRVKKVKNLTPLEMQLRRDENGTPYLRGTNLDLNIWSVFNHAGSPEEVELKFHGEKGKETATDWVYVNQDSDNLFKIYGGTESESNHPTNLMSLYRFKATITTPVRVPEKVGMRNGVPVISYRWVDKEIDTTFACVGPKLALTFISPTAGNVGTGGAKDRKPLGGFNGAPKPGENGYSYYGENRPVGDGFKVPAEKNR